VARKPHTPAYLHALARLLVGTRAADEARATGGMLYEDLTERVKDRNLGRDLLWRPSDTTKEGSLDDDT
jgi:hypothetical protein